MLRKLTLGAIGALMIGLPAGMASAQGQNCPAGTVLKGNSCVKVEQTQQAPAQKSGKDQQAAPQSKSQPAAKSSETRKTTETKKTTQTAAAPSKSNSAKKEVKTGDRLAGSPTKMKNPEKYGLTPSTHYTYYESDGQVYRVDNNTQKVIALMGAIVALTK